MRYYSTNHRIPPVSFSEAVFKGLPEDNGLFMPENIPALSKAFIKELPGKSFTEVAMEIIRPFVGDEIDEEALGEIISQAFNFDIPLVPLGKRIHVLELFHGPTLAFKDFGARFMARIMAHFLKNDDRKVHILVATSGDTGSAVAQGFFGVEGIEVTLLYPKGKVSKIQEQQLTTVGGNVTALEVEGTFDDCQRMVKEAFLDKQLNEKLQLSSANSINIARLLPQSLYYAYAAGKLMYADKPIVVSVPSGNFGNLCGGLMAKRMGIPIEFFIAATNINKVVPEYLATGNFTPRASIRTISNAMDVGNPSNFARILDLYKNDHETITRDILGAFFTDQDTESFIRAVHHDHGYLMCPHTAIGYGALKAAFENMEEPVGVCLSTAHPAKFTDVVEPLTLAGVDIPGKLKMIIKKKKSAIPMDGEPRHLKTYLMNKA